MRSTGPNLKETYHFYWCLRVWPILWLKQPVFACGRCGSGGAMHQKVAGMISRQHVPTLLVWFLVRVCTGGNLMLFLSQMDVSLSPFLSLIWCIFPSDFYGREGWGGERESHQLVASTCAGTMGLGQTSNLGMSPQLKIKPTTFQSTGQRSNHWATARADPLFFNWALCCFFIEL